MASARWIVAGSLGIACALGGCVSTQQKNARAKLTAERELASRRPLALGGRESRVVVERVAAVRGRRATAFVVTLRNRAEEPLTDLPIAVGVGRAGSRALNGRRGLGWFETHVPSVGAGARVDWVFTARSGAVPAGRPWARVGRPSLSSASRLPRLIATIATGDGEGRAAAVVPSRVSSSATTPTCPSATCSWSRWWAPTAAGRRPAARASSSSAPARRRARRCR